MFLKISFLNIFQLACRLQNTWLRQQQRGEILICFFNFVKHFSKNFLSTQSAEPASGLSPRLRTTTSPKRSREQRSPLFWHRFLGVNKRSSKFFSEVSRRKPNPCSPGKGGAPAQFAAVCTSVQRTAARSRKLLLRHCEWLFAFEYAWQGGRKPLGIRTKHPLLDRRYL